VPINFLAKFYLGIENIEGLAFDLKGILSESFGNSAFHLFRSVLILADLMLILKNLTIVEKTLLRKKIFLISNSRAEFAREFADGYILS